MQPGPGHRSCPRGQERSRPIEWCRGAFSPGSIIFKNVPASGENARGRIQGAGAALRPTAASLLPGGVPDPRPFHRECGASALPGTAVLPSECRSQGPSQRVRSGPRRPGALCPGLVPGRAAACHTLSSRLCGGLGDGTYLGRCSARSFSLTFVLSPETLIEMSSCCRKPSKLAVEWLRRGRQATLPFPDAECRQVSSS